MKLDSRQLARTIARGLQLAEAPMQVTSKQSLLEAKGWKEMVEGIKSDTKKAFVTLMLENYRLSRMDLDEATTTMQVGNFDKFAFPLLSIVSENLIAQDIVSVQPLEGPSGLVFYMNFVTGQQKGNVARGAHIWDARTGHADRMLDSADRVETEFVGSTTGGGAFVAGQALSYTPVMPGTVTVTLDSGGSPATLTDDANGNLLDSGASVVGNINYNTGELTNGVGLGAAVTIETTYNYNPEINQDAQQVDFEISSSPIFTQERKLRGRWSTEAAQALEALHKVNAENIVSTAIANHLQWEIDREIIEDLRRQAGAGVVNWSANIPAGSTISYTEHKLSFVDAMVTASSFIQRATNRVKANWMLAGIQPSNIIETLPQFEPVAGDKAEIEGVAQIGTLGRMRIYSDPHYPIAEALLGYKGNDFVRTGYIFAPWILLFSTPLITLDDFISRKGFASQYGKKTVNTKFYSRITLTNMSASFGG
jgi:hypothetical protein